MMNLEKYRKIALALDSQDPLKMFRKHFSLPKSPDIIYFCSHSLGLPALSTFSKMQQELQHWSELGIEGWFERKSNWYHSFDAPLKEPLSHLLGAKKEEVSVMNSLTVNLHLLLVSFYRPTASRF